MAPYIEDGEYVPGWKKRRRFRDMAFTDMDEEMEKYSEDLPKDETETSEDQPKKKRRRQKKGKKKDSEETNSSEKDTPAVEETETKASTAGDTKAGISTDATEETTKTKRSRKKKGKKAKKSESSTADIPESTIENHDDKESVKDVEEDLTPNEEPKVKKDKKKKKKKSSKKKQKVEGVSSSRLASYGLN